MNIFELILWPFRWAVSAVLWAFHELLTLVGMDPASGLTWGLCIVGLTVVMRTLTIPLFMKQIKSMRGLQEMQPEIAKIQQKYKGKTDQLSRQAMGQEQMALYKKHGSNPLSTCLPVIAQMPIFFALYQVLSGVPAAAANNQGLHVLSATTVQQFSQAKFLGAPLFSGLLNPAAGAAAVTTVLCVVMIILMSVSQFYSMKVLGAKNMSESAKTSPMYRQQQMMIYLFPILFAVIGINFPIGVLIYMVVSNLWSVGQQLWLIKRNPTPGSDAERELNERRAEKGLPPVGKTKEEHENDLEEQRKRAAAGQRQQPVGKKRKKKQNRGSES